MEYSNQLFNKSILSFLFILINTALFAQEEYTIRGSISDVINGETVFGASVYLKGTTMGTTTKIL